ncbi:hypothetical protein LTR40_013427, partial [Exophiala xenobiotica]
AIRETQAQYDDKLEKLFTELDEVKKGAEDMPDAAELEDAKANLQAATKSIASLNSELDGAMLEVETQRTMAETAQRELGQLKQAQKERELVALPSPKRRGKSRSPRRKSMNPLSPTGPKKGLESSKWAASESSPSGEAQASPVQGEESAHSLRGGDIDEQGTDAAVGSEAILSEPAQNASADGKRNLAGQLAGIHEEIKQLGELSEDMFEDHQRMARTLNKVDDSMTTTVEVQEEGVDE